MEIQLSNFSNSTFRNGGFHPSRVLTRITSRLVDRGEPVDHDNKGKLDRGEIQKLAPFLRHRHRVGDASADGGSDCPWEGGGGGGGRIRHTGRARVPRFINSRWRNLTQCISSPLLHGRSRNPPPPPPPCSADSWNFSWHNDFRRNTSSPPPRFEHYENCVATGNGWTKRTNYFHRVPRTREFHPSSAYEPKNFAIGFSNPIRSDRIFGRSMPRFKRGDFSHN